MQLEERIRTVSLTKSQRRIADIALSEPERIAASTIEELAKELGVNQSTIVRFSRALGFSGYAPMRTLCRQASRDRNSMLKRFIRHESADAAAGEVEARMVFAAGDQRAIAETSARIDSQMWSSVVRLLAQSEQVGVVGLRQSRAIAAMLAYLLGLIRPEVVELTERFGLNVDDLAKMKSESVLLVIATQPASRASVEAARWAHEHGLTVVGLVDAATSPLLKFCDQVLIASSTGESLLSSMTALASVVQALANDVAATNPERTQKMLKKEGGVLEDFSVYYS